MNKKEVIHLTASVLLILATGLLSGYCIGYMQTKKMDFPEITEAGEINPGIATVKFMKLEGNKLIGRIDGKEARLAYSLENILTLNPGEDFEIPIYEVKLADFYTTETLPEEAQFIASLQGKYYYHILDPGAFRITPKNRVYFTDEQQAIRSGYLPKE